MPSPINQRLLQNGWQLVPGRVTVQFRRQTAPGTYTATTVRDAWRRHKGTSEAAPSLGAYLFDAVDWYFPMARYPSSPLPGDVVRYNSQDYYIDPDGVQEVGAQGSWLCHTRRPNISAALSEDITIYRPTAGVDAEYRITQASATVIANAVPCAVQVADTFGVVAVGVEEILGKLQQPQLVTIYLPVTVRLQPHDYIQRADGSKYSLSGDLKINRLGEFMALNCTALL